MHNESYYSDYYGAARFAAAASFWRFCFAHKALSGWIAGIGGAVGSLRTAARFVSRWTFSAMVSGVMPFTAYMLQITPLNAIWLITPGLEADRSSACSISIGNRHPAGKANG